MVWGNTVYHCGEGVVLGAPVAMGTESSCLFISVDQKTGMEERKPAVNLKFFPPHGLSFSSKSQLLKVTQPTETTLHHEAQCLNT